MISHMLFFDSFFLLNICSNEMLAFILKVVSSVAAKFPIIVSSSSFISSFTPSIPFEINSNCKRFGWKDSAFLSIYKLLLITLFSKFITSVYLLQYNYRSIKYFCNHYIRHVFVFNSKVILFK